MSKISLKSSSSGTATFTIESPATNTDRTLNLPDGSGALYNQSNIVGTVSQSSGVPTGAIIERGSNANGEFVKYADGTMICQYRQVWNTGTWSSYGSALFQSGNTPWTFPAPFFNTTYAVNIAGDTAFFLFSGSVPQTTSVIIKIGFLTIPAINRTFTATAIGRWF